MICLLVLFVAVGAFASGEKEQAAKKSEIGGSISFWTFLDPKDTGPRSVVQQELVKEFETKYDVKVEVILKYWADIPGDLIRATAGGMAPDVSRISMPKDWQLFLAADVLAPLSDYVDFTEEDQKDWLLEWDSTVKDGKKYSLPIEHRFITLWSNPKHFKEIGADTPDSWDDLIVKGSKLSGMGYVGYALPISKKTQVNGLMEYFDSAYYSLGQTTVDEKGYATWGDTPEAVKVVEKLKEMIDKNAVPKECLAWGVDESHRGYNAGKVAMMNYGTHRVFTTLKAGQDVIVTGMPSFDKGKYSPSYTSGWHLGVTSTSKNKPTAAAFVVHMTSTEAQIQNAKVAGEVPSRKSPYKDSWFSTDDNGKWMMQWQDLLFEVGVMMNFFEDWIPMRLALADAVQEIVYKDAPIKATLKKHADTFNAKHKEVIGE